MFRSFMSQGTREAFRAGMEEAQAEIQALREANGDVSQEAIEEIMSSRMQTIAADVQRMRIESGEQAETQALMGQIARHA